MLLKHWLKLLKGPDSSGMQWFLFISVEKAFNNKYIWLNGTKIFGGLCYE
jgi:hypothetical protein